MIACQFHITAGNPLIILCKDAYCNKVRHYKFGSTDITCIFAKNYEKSDTSSFTLTLFSRQCVALQTTESVLLMEQLIMHI